MKLRKKTMAILLFSIAFIAILCITALALWQKESATPPTIPVPPSEPPTQTVADGQLYPALAENGQWGYIDHTGKLVIAANYQTAEPFWGEIAWVQKADHWGAINAQGEIIVPFDYTEKINLDDGLLGLAVLKQPGNASLYNKDGHKLFGVNGEIGTLTGNLIPFSRTTGEKALWGCIDITGQIVIEPIYQAIGNVSKQTVLAQTTEQQTVKINLQNNSVTTLQQPVELTALGDDLLLCQNEYGVWGYTNLQQEIVIPYQFHYAEIFREGSALVKKENGYGLIDTEGNWLVEPIYEAASYLGYGYYRFAKQDQAAASIIDTKGKVVLAEAAYETGSWQKGILPIQTAKNTQFLQAGNGILTTPTAPLYYQLEYLGTLFYVQDENGITYYQSQSPYEVVYSMGRDYYFDEQLAMKTRLQAEEVDYQVYYPEFVALEDSTLAESYEILNERFKENALGDYYIDHKNPNGSINFTVRGTYQYQKIGDLMTVLQKLIINDLWVSMRDGSEPEEIYETVCFQPSTGRQFQLSALFAQGVNWRNDLLQPLQDVYTASCAGQNIPEDPMVLDGLSQRLSRNIPYTIDDKTLTIFLKNSKGAYTAISLPFEEIQSLIDTEGDLWQSLHQNTDQNTKQ